MFISYASLLLEDKNSKWFVENFLENVINDKSLLVPIYLNSLPHNHDF